MIKINNGSIQSTSCRIGHIDAIAYNGCEFSLLTPKQKGIVQLDDHLCPLVSHNTCRKYHCLCYCKQRCCYWTMSMQRPNTLFMLDENFNEIDTMMLPFTNCSQPCAISCSPCGDTLMILFLNSIVFFDLCSHCYRREPIDNHNLQPYDILALHCGYVLVYYQDHKFFLEITCSEFGKPRCFCIPDNFSFEGMYLYHVCQTSYNCIEYEIHLILCDIKTRNQCILPLFITCCEEADGCACNCGCGCEEEDGCACNCGCEAKEHCGDDERCECGCEDHQKTCRHGIYEILHSIALEEASLAHILNAEGEKIQKAVASNTTIAELLQINESVRNTICKVTILEGQLIAKLENALCFCKACDEEDCSCPLEPKDAVDR